MSTKLTELFLSYYCDERLNYPNLNNVDFSLHSFWLSREVGCIHLFNKLKDSKNFSKTHRFLHFLLFFLSPKNNILFFPEKEEYEIFFVYLFYLYKNNI